ncbi:MAG: phosphomannomutase/phosphoglucomutase [Actinomycetia bacterium]|nr:phosphomannomutase/phosphoglucomutase [Actinomycetes bacterium]
MSGFDAIFKAYDVRGIYPDQIDAPRCRAIGAAFARFLVTDDPGVTQVVVAHDMRPSGPELVEAFTAGVVEQGLDVIEMGLASTDMMYFASGHLDAPGAVFTASHNPAQYNGIKMCRRAAAPIGEDSGLAEIKATAESGLEPAGSTGSVSSTDLLDGFANHVLSFVDGSAMRPLKVVADTANGMGGLVVPAVFSRLPFELEVLFPELDGTFPNHPADPLNPDNLVDLQRRVLETGADIGLAFDGDADRVFLVDEKAQPVSGSLTTALLARAMLEKEPGGQVIHNLICSKSVPEVVTEAGGTPVRSRVGHSFIKQVMAETGAIFGGEHSAHYYFRDNWRADSGLIAAVKVLEQLCLSGGSLSTLLAPLDRYAASGEINTKVANTAAVIDHVADHYADVASDQLDGLTVDAGDWWFNLRPSNTEPLLRLNLEAATEEDCARRVAEVQAVMASA